MKRPTAFYRGLLSLCLILMATFSLSVRGQSAYYFQEPTQPFDTVYTDLFQDLGTASDSVQSVSTLIRSGEAEVDYVFLQDKFYLVFDKSGNRRVYPFNYYGKVADYEQECQLNGLLEQSFSLNCLLDGVFRYYTQP